ncbi:homoserine dehydrogenase [Lacticaseibacillus pabuli]|uniref:Homoserine dehydrogenase n=1 Tax=Lacticaseibacillus pabuli TaxID=3025672 RepID=A0ABY7WTK8_9LACO|nr:homoserine dehydrogenase [Lacticaseibacillus sp. KACC 23028]WDF82490.1 homoserine dehydrogenase [Lacticaseibacillus sp. KACC 23028]
MSQINIGLLGLGTVGNGVVNILRANRPQLAALNLKITRAAVRNLYPKREALYADIALTTDPASIVADPDIDIVVEVMGGVKDTYPLLVAALKHGKHVISANKDLLSEYGPALTDLARANHVGLYYEAAVTGAIPILHTLSQSYAGDTITRVAGIVNGTSNYILTQMVREGRTYEAALKSAQELGFAEANPKNDIEGFDACYKLLILSRFAFGMTPKLTDIDRQGITDLTAGDFKAARTLGYVIKPLAVAAMQEGKLVLTVSPQLVASSHPLASIIYENNAVLVDSLNTKEIMMSGPGAGSLPTANSVIADLNTIASAIRDNREPAPFTSLRAETVVANGNDRRAARLVAVRRPESAADAVRTAIGTTYTKPLTENGVSYVLTKTLSCDQVEDVKAKINAIDGAEFLHALPVFE